MNFLDLAVVVLAVAAAIGGYRLGFLARAVSWVGLAVGLYLAARFLPQIISWLNPGQSTERLLVAFAVLIGGALAGQALGLIAGSRLHRALPLGPIRTVDRGVGAAVGAVGVLVALWLLLPSIAAAPGWPARAATTSSISRWVDSQLPRPPDALQALRRLVGDSFPQVFANLHAGEQLGAAPASAGISAAADARVRNATVKVEGEACNRIQDGSGFAVANDLVATNAHVVAGEGRGKTKVLLPNGTTRLPATVVLFDPNRDLALLQVPGLGETPLPRGDGHIGQIGAVYGHPNGQDPLALAPAQIAQNVTAVGRDLYDSHETTRNVFILSSVLHPGDSGAPLVDQNGVVLGVAFAIAPDRTTTAYALATSELNAVLRQPIAAAVGTGSCLG